MSEAPGAAWWGKWHLELGETRFWRVGPLELWVERRRHEWLIRRRRSGDPMDSALEVATERTPPEDDASLEIDRVAGEETDGRLTLSPRLADRAVIVRPRSPFHALEGAKVDLFVSSPLWVRVATGPDGDLDLLDLPTHRPSDTWFGANTLTGHKAYAVSASCRVDLEGLPVRPHRAVTPLRIKNPGPGALDFVRIAVPVPNLSLYAGEGGRLWTETLKLTRRDDNHGVADAEVQAGAPAQAGESQLVAPPREVAGTRILRVFDTLF